MAANEYLEDLSSLLPALQLLQNLGYEYLTPSETVALRGGKRSGCVLEEVLSKQLAKINGIEFKGNKHTFSDANIKNAVQSISHMPFDALMTNNEAIYDLLTLGKSFEQTIDGYARSYSLQYIDWKNPENNVFHVTDEFEVERRNSKQTRRPDIVVFVNGIPLVVIECKRPDLKDAVKEAISQQLRNQKSDEIPELFTFSQILMALSQNQAQYATTDTPLKFWSVWKEDEESHEEPELRKLINASLPTKAQARMYSERNEHQRRYMENIASSGERLVSPQDWAIYNMLRKERLLKLIYQFIVFDNKVKKICRYQQFYAIKATLDRVTKQRGDSTRQGGVIWHTTGSGKSLTMVMLAKALALEPSIENPKVILVTDRVDLDDQIYDTFKNCGKQVKQAESGEHLIELVHYNKANIITTIIDKFESASKKKKIRDESTNIFVLVDESHRSQYGIAHAKMHNVFPNACYIGFTGTPLLKKEKSTANKFGGFIHKYTMNQAVKDGAVAPLIYEGRMSELHGDKDQLDRWFERITSNLTDEQKLDLKKKFKREEELSKSDARIAEIAYDIAEHYKSTYRGTGKKGQLAVSSKEMAIKYLRLLEGFGVEVSVIVSSPDTREDHTSTDESEIPAVQQFWKAMMAKYGSEKKYADAVTDAFKYSDTPEIIIVVDKLLTGFDAPRNSVLYIDKPLKEHNILQAIARVNRLHEGKEYGLIVDYRGIFGELNEAIDTYRALEREGFDPEDIEGTITDVTEEIKKLPQRHTDLWQVFKEVENKNDIEALQRHLEPLDVREEFYEHLKEYAKTLQLSLSNSKFQDETPEDKKKKYTDDLKRFLNLRAAVKQRYAESIDYSSYELQIRNMVNKYIGAEQVKQLIAPVNVFDTENFELELEKIEGEAAKADAIASRMKKTITEKMDEDPALYKRLSELIEEAIADHRAQRLSDALYLERVKNALDEMKKQGTSSLPVSLAGYEDAKAYYGVILDYLPLSSPTKAKEDIAADIAIRVEELINTHKIRDWVHKIDIQNAMINSIEEYLFSMKGRYDLSFSLGELDQALEFLINTAKRREGYGN
ncbi:MAG: restriction endonuclease subunit R [Micavibrio sp. TMED27]|nr:restriction endonuclease subunit R [Micavibrio sp.]OUT91577.1 MAG: restriction endonuclease subunit R [Micavibrio sp. TMED27]|tara:strand:- start:933 stop:4130 length:3198 start_codon:yes stop_codon:yes gene_type:complete